MVRKETETDSYLSFTGAGQDFPGHIENVRRRPFHQQAKEPTLTEVEKEALGALVPVAKRVAFSLARRDESGAEQTRELVQHASSLTIEAMRAFDGRGSVEAFVGQYVRQRLLDGRRRERTGKRIAGKLWDHAHDRRRGRIVDDDEQVADNRYSRPSLSESPSHNLQLEESVAAVRHCLSGRDLEILRLRSSGMKPDAIAQLLRLTPRRVRGIVREIGWLVDREALETGLRTCDIVAALLTSDSIAREQAIRLLGGDEPEKCSEK